MVEGIWNLGFVPHGNNFSTSRDEAIAQPRAPLVLGLCFACQLLQLVSTSPPRKRGTTEDRHSYPGNTLRLAARLGLTARDLIVEVQSQSGKNLQEVAERGLRVLGIEESPGLARKANYAGIPTVTTSLSIRKAEEIRRTFGPAKLVVANFCGANAADPREFFRALRTLVGPTGHISVVNGYHPEQFSRNMFDYINFDHLSYFSVASLSKIFQHADLKMLTADVVELKGGSLHCLAAPADSRDVSDRSVSELKFHEEKMKSNEPTVVTALASRVRELRTRVADILRNVEGVHVGIGASINSSMVLELFDLSTNLEWLVDDDNAKIGRFSAGIGLPIRAMSSPSAFDSSVPVLLAWSKLYEITKRLREVGYNGQLVVPLPTPRVVAVH